VIGSPHQSRGYAREAAAAMIAWLRSTRVTGLTAHVRADNVASAAVARAVGLVATTEVDDGETLWRG
jgi:RimJ/RimL family protein N-acetyltransferase